MVAAALRYQIVGARSAFVEAFRAKCLRVLPYARIMIGAVQVEQDPLAFAERMPAPVEAFVHAVTDEGVEWEETPHLPPDRIRQREGRRVGHEGVMTLYTGVGPV